jgi:uncharacterized protein (DUF433 family)
MVDGAKRGSGFGLYGGLDPADLPRYTYIDAARATNVPVSTIGAWLRGTTYKSPGGKPGFFQPVITRPDESDTRLSFNNLLEVNVLRALRQVHEVKVQAVRNAIERARKDHGINRLLTHPNLRTSGGKLFLDYYFELVELSPTQQLAMQVMLRHSLQRVQVDNRQVHGFFPVPRFTSQDARPILVSPYVSFGNAIIERRGVTTNAIRSRFDLGEKKAAIIADYGLNAEEFDEAILYEAAA